MDSPPDSLPKQPHRWTFSRILLYAGAGFLVLVLLAGIFLYFALRVPGIDLPSGVSRETHRVPLTGRRVALDIYLPAGTQPVRPVVVMAHGFSRNRRTMAGWGAALAKEGFVCVVPDLPSLADHPRNGRALRELLQEIRAGQVLPRDTRAGRIALAGFSAGGFSTLLAAAGNTNVACWVGLDPVGAGPMSREAAREVHVPGFVLRAEPAPWNAFGNAADIFDALAGPACGLIVTGASHVDAEFPTSRAARWACGATDPARGQLFGRFLEASLRAGLLDDTAAWTEWKTAGAVPGIRDVSIRQPVVK